MNQGKLEVVKQEMSRVSIYILGISKLKWTEMGKFNSGDHCIYCGQESLRRNGLVLIVNERVWNVVLGSSLKNDTMISVRFQGKPFNITVIQVYAPNSNAEEAEVEQFCEDLLEKEMAAHSSILAWRILWTEGPGGLLSMGSHRVGHEWSDSACMHENLQDLLELTPQKDVFFIIGDWNAKVEVKKHLE